MKIKANILTFCILSSIAGLFLYAFQQQWIIFRSAQPVSSLPRPLYTKKTVSFFFWNHHRWNSESQELLWSSKAHENLATIVTQWLSFLDAEHVFPKKVTLQSVTLSANLQEAYISFDRAIVPKEWSIQRKWMLIEGLLKTIRTTDLSISSIYFLVHHQPMVDRHLDFSLAWPIAGFIKS